MNPWLHPKYASFTYDGNVQTNDPQGSPLPLIPLSAGHRIVVLSVTNGQSGSDSGAMFYSHASQSLLVPEFTGSASCNQGLFATSQGDGIDVDWRSTGFMTYILDPFVS